MFRAETLHYIYERIVGTQNDTIPALQIHTKDLSLVSNCPCRHWSVASDFAKSLSTTVQNRSRLGHKPRPNNTRPRCLVGWTGRGRTTLTEKASSSPGGRAVIRTSDVAPPPARPHVRGHVSAEKRFQQ